MSYTNVQLVESHLVANAPVQNRMLDQPLVLTGADYLPFYSGPVESESLVVKTLRGHGMQRQTMTLTAGGNAIGTAPLVPGMVVVASDSSLGYVYQKGVDYFVDHAEARLVYLDGGALNEGRTVVVWSLPYVRMSSGSDYGIEADRGRVRRLASGGIIDGETVYVDFTPLHQAFTEAILQSAVVEANGTIESELDPDGEFGADPSLQAAATYRALTTVCHTAAARALAVAGSDDRVALAWIKLAEVFDERSAIYLAAFRPRFDGPAAPRHS